MIVHSLESLARDYNSEVVVPNTWQPLNFDRPNWMWIKTVAQGGLEKDMKIQDIRIGEGDAAKRLTCMHRTQPKRNFTVFYRRIDVNMILVIGIGMHISDNKKYKVEWVDGRKNRISLSDKKINGQHYLINPIGGMFNFKTLDPLINELFYQS